MWEKASSVGHDASIDNILDWTGIRKESGEVNSKKAYARNEASCQILNTCYTSKSKTLYFIR
jgi:hypothetical protein